MRMVLKTICNRVKKLPQAEDGATAIEYALIAGSIGLPLAAALKVFFPSAVQPFITFANLLNLSG